MTRRYRATKKARLTPGFFAHTSIFLPPERGSIQMNDLFVLEYYKVTYSGAYKKGRSYERPFWIDERSNGD